MTASASAPCTPSSPGVVSGGAAFVATLDSAARAAGSSVASIVGSVADVVVVSSAGVVVGSLGVGTLGGVGGVGGVEACALTPGTTMESPTTATSNPRR